MFIYTSKTFHNVQRLTENMCTKSDSIILQTKFERNRFIQIVFGEYRNEVIVLKILSRLDKHSFCSQL